MIGAFVTSLILDKRETKIRSMFNNIAPSYDLLNHLLSCNVDHYWRWQTTRRVALIEISSAGKRPARHKPSFPSGSFNGAGAYRMTDASRSDAESRFCESRVFRNFDT